jgi:hypothetical protein
MTDLRSMLLSGGTVPRKNVTVTITNPDGTTRSVTVECRGLSAEARGRLMTHAMVKTGEENEEGEQEERVDLGKISPELVIEGAFIPGTDARVFSPEDRDAVGALSASFLDPIITTVSSLTGLSATAAKSMEGNSVTTTTSDSVSPSPAN